VNAPSTPQELLSHLVEVPSPSGEEQAVFERTSALCDSFGLAHERIGDSLLVRVGGGGTRILLNSHYDTVPIGQGWEGDPYNSTWKDGRLVARGANDAKASVAAMLWAASRLIDTPLAGELLVAITAREETNNAGMGDVLEAIGMPDLAVTGEPTGLEVVRSQSGLAILVAEWSGKSCHAAHVARVENVNALHVACSEIAQLPASLRLPDEHPLLGISTIAPTVLRSGERHNTIPDEASLVFDARLAPPYTGEDCRELLSSLLPSASIRCRSDRLRARDTAADHALVQCGLRAAGKEQAIGSRTLSDMALLAGVPAIKCGPGETARSHTANEWVTEDELLAGCAFYEKLVPAALAACESVKA